VTEAMTFNASNHPHRRYDPLADRWVLVSPHRATRPWLGSEEAINLPTLLHHDPECFLCPGNRRAIDIVNPDYSGPYVFANDFPSVLTTTPKPPAHADPLFRAAAVGGEARVICYSPDHARSLGQLDHDAIVAVIDCWCDQTSQLGECYSNVQIFENRGAMMGASNPHPHGQIWATHHVPDIVATEDRTQFAWHSLNGQPMLSSLADREASGERSVVETEYWIVIIPYWASWPFETLVLPKFRAKRMTDLGNVHRVDLAIALRQLLSKYDGLFECPFPYSMGWHGVPFGDDATDHWQLHAHFYPPLLRSASVRKFMVGYEMLAEAQRDLTPEQAAKRLRDVRICDD
jgi:UDPglucose--hexose-1-phosphate uridylyltransferase